MAKEALEQALADLRSLKGKPVTDESRAVLIKALSGKSNILAAKAAEMIGATPAFDLNEQLELAFARFLEKPTSTDKGCLAKTAIAKALHAAQAPAERTFVAGAKFRQPETGWGGATDAAGELRGVCAMGLAQIGYRDALMIFADLLNDEIATVRTQAARAIAASGRDEGALLLRMKLLAGDRESDVLAECLSSLAQLAPVKSVDFLARFLDAGDEVISVAAALALGETRLDAALQKLKDAWPRWGRHRYRATYLQAIAILRLPSAIDFLLQILKEEPDNVGLEILDALKLFRGDSKSVNTIRSVITSMKSTVLQSHFETHF